MTTASSITSIALAGLCACAVRDGGVPFAMTPAGRAVCGDPGDAPQLALDVPVRTSDADEAARIRARCRGEPLGTRRYHFVAPRTATYRFAMRASYPASLSIEWARTEARERHSVALGGETSDDLLVTLREGDTHAAVIYYNDPSTEAAPPPSAVEMTLPVDLYDNRSTEDKPAPKPPQVTTWFELVVKLDESPVARIRPEDAALAQRLIAAAPRLVPGRTLGTFESVAAGLRASCGGLGSGTAYAVDVANPGTLALRVAAQFPVALEVRDRSGAALGCARAEIDRFETSLALELPAGSYVAIVDSAGLGPALFGSQVEAAPPGAGVRGGFALDVEVTP